jgi:hypothetical protein
MKLLDKVTDNPFICGIEIAFNGELLPSDIPEWQSFFNSKMLGTDFTKTHIGLGSVSYGEESATGTGGPMWKQSVTIRFPSTDANRSQRLALIQKARFIKLKLTNGKDLIIGRNDIKQNARPKIQIKTNIKTAEAQFETVSIFPAGFVSDDQQIGLPLLIPILLYI